MVVNLTTHLDQQRFEVAVISLADALGSVLEQRLAERRLRVWYLGKEPGFDPRMLRRIRNVVREFRPHIVHTHLCVHYVFPSLTRLRPLRHVDTVHLPFKSNHWRKLLWLHRIAYRRGVIPVAVSRYVAERVERLYNVRNCLVIPNGIPVADFRPSASSRQIWRKEWGYQEQDVLLVCVARLEKQKNHAMLLRAFARAVEAVSGAHLLLVGEGGCRGDLELQARELRLQGKVHFLGQRSDVTEVLGAADIFVLASQDEGNPLSLMEAMAVGLPVVATAVGGVPELIEDHRSGLLVKPDDSDGTANAMLRLLQDTEMRRTMAASAVQRAIQTFSVSGMARRYTEFYERILACSGPLAWESKQAVPAIPAP
jgi:glycosyltransferase involved in cell wall biosynthesis